MRAGEDAVGGQGGVEKGSPGLGTAWAKPWKQECVWACMENKDRMKGLLGKEASLKIAEEEKQERRFQKSGEGRAS